MAVSADDPTAQWKAKVCLVGGTGVGKTSLIRRYVQDAFDDRYLITLGTKVVKRVVELEFPQVGSVRVDLTLWDTMGEEFLRPTLFDTVLGGAKAVVVVVDVTDPRTLAPMNAWIDLSRQVSAETPIQILLNKSDLPPSKDVLVEALEVGRQKNAPCYMTSAKTGNNVVSAFEDLARRIAAKTYGERDDGLDPVGKQIISHAASRERTLQDFLILTRLPTTILQAHLEMLVGRGRLRIVSLDIGPDGCPVIKYTAGTAPTPSAMTPLTPGPMQRP